MRQALRIVALILALSAPTLWLAAGANRGWTKTSIRTTTLDEITGIEAVSYEKRFVPGVDFLGGALLAAGTAACASLLFRKHTHPENPSTNSIA